MRFNQDKAVAARSLRELKFSPEVLALNRTNKIGTALPPFLGSIEPLETVGSIEPLEIGTIGSQTLHCAVAELLIRTWGDYDMCQMSKGTPLTASGICYTQGL